MKLPEPVDPDSPWTELELAMGCRVLKWEQSKEDRRRLNVTWQYLKPIPYVEVEVDLDL